MPNLMTQVIRVMIMLIKKGNEQAKKNLFTLRNAEKHIDYLEENFLKPLKQAEEKSGKILLAQKDRKTLQKIYGIIDRNAVYLTSNNEIAGELMG
jgi:hypothetical protein